MSNEEADKYDQLNTQLDLLFPDAKFSICCVESIEDLNKLIDGENEIIILKITKNCYCFSNCPTPNEYINVKRKSNTNSITIRDCIETLIEYNFNPECNHMFLEGFDKTKLSSIQYEPSFGS